MSRSASTDNQLLCVKVDRSLAQAFKNIASANNRNQSTLVRDFMLYYVRKNGQLEINFDK